MFPAARVTIGQCLKIDILGPGVTASTVFNKIVRSLKDGNRSLKGVHKLLIHTVGDRSYSAQETCHILIQLPMYKASRDFIVLSLDGSRAVEEHIQHDGRATALSILDHYLP